MEKEKYEIYDKNNALVDEKDFEIKSKGIISNSIRKADNEYFDGVSKSISDVLNKKSTTSLKNEMDKNQKRYMRNMVISAQNIRVHRIMSLCLGSAKKRMLFLTLFMSL